MRRGVRWLVWLRVLFGAAGLSAALVLACAERLQPQDLVIENPVIIPDKAAQALFDAAWRWSRDQQLETGGCFRIFHVVNNVVIVVGAEERVLWRRTHKVALDCEPEAGEWHTHWSPESENAAGCNVKRSRDPYLIDERVALGLVVCGVGRAYLIPYSYSEDANTEHETYLMQHPSAARDERAERIASHAYTCRDESAASLRRPTVRCAQ